MDEMREAALAYYEAGSEELKRLAWNFFHSMDEDRDGVISYWEFMKFLRQRGYEVDNYRCFMEVDTDGSGYLDFYEILVYYYIVRVGRRSCKECKRMIKGLYFTCVTCFDYCDESYDLCFTCYRHGRNFHNHTSFLDNYAMLMSKKASFSAAACSNTTNYSTISTTSWAEGEKERGREEIREAAQAYFYGGSEQLRQQAWNFFSCMDVDRDGRISYWDFIEFQSQRGYRGNNYNSFIELDRDRNGYLDFNELLVFFYINQVGRPSCKECKALVKALYFTCVRCFDSCHESYNLCSTCYRHRRYAHDHTFFLDNYAMLISKKRSSSASTNAYTPNTSLVVSTPRPETRIIIYAPMIVYAPPTTSSWEKIVKALEAFELALRLGATAFCAASVCSIM